MGNPWKMIWCLSTIFRHWSKSAVILYLTGKLLREEIVQRSRIRKSENTGRVFSFVVARKTMVVTGNGFFPLLDVK